VYLPSLYLLLLLKSRSGNVERLSWRLCSSDGCGGSRPLLLLSSADRQEGASTGALLHNEWNSKT
jgi:hypothetical protein